MAKAMKGAKPPKAPKPMTEAEGMKLWRGSPADRKQDKSTGVDTPADKKADKKNVGRIVAGVNSKLGNH